MGDEIQHLSELIETMPLGLALLDVWENDRGGVETRLRYMNLAFGKLSGVMGPNTCAGLSEVVKGAVDPEKLTPLLSSPPGENTVSYRVVPEGLSGEIEVRAYCPESGRIVLIAVEVAGDQRFANELVESELSFRSIAENADVAILVFQTKKRSFSYVNRRACGLTGYSKQELRSIRAEKMLDPAEYGKIKSRLKKKIKGDPVPQRFETKLIRKDGTLVPVEFTISRTRWGQERAVLIIIRDIALRKRLEEELGKIHQDLETKVKERTVELMEAAEKLEQNQLELMRHKKDLERANRELVQTNTALSVLARNIDKKRDDYEKQIAQTITSQIVPLIEELKQDKMPERSRTKLESKTKCRREAGRNSRFYRPI
jgi:PAS domain S-box-containing protein